MAYFDEWIPDGQLTATSGTLSGDGFYPLSSLDATGLNAPTDGVIVWRFNLIVAVVAFDPAVVWNANTAFSDQFRAGRFLLWGRDGLGEEHFINRPQNRVRDLWYYDADFGEASGGTIGSGNAFVTLSNETVGARYCERVYYGCEPSVSVVVRVEGTYMVLDNPENFCTFDLIRG